jgi:Putative amidoligase enzyme
MTGSGTARPWKTGFEIELLAPKGLTRKDLAKAIARTMGGEVRTVFYPQSEPSLVPGLPVFENLVLGFDVRDADGDRIALCVDDLTIRDGLNRSAAPVPGWMRILSDDARLLELVKRQCDPEASPAEVLEPIAALYGTLVEQAEGGIAKIADSTARSIAMAAPLPGERERPCELITPPYDTDPGPALAALLQYAIGLGFTVPKEAAVHIHFDAASLCSAPALSRLILVLDRHGSFLRRIVRTNPHCVRLGPITPGIVALARSEAFKSADWEEARRKLAELKPTKYADFNLLNIAHSLPGKHTFEARIFPGTMEASDILRFARLMEAVLVWAVAGKSAIPEEGRLLAALDLSAADRDAWAVRAREV